MVTKEHTGAEERGGKQPEQRRPSREALVMGGLLLLVPLTYVASLLGWPSWLQFFLAVGGVVPLAAYIGWATESLADRLGGKVGGLLNATFGNAPDLLVGVFGVQKGLIPLVKATMIGAMISNSALIMGLCCVVAGLAHGRPRFKRQEAGHHSVLMMLTVAALLFPSAGAFVLCPDLTCADTRPSLLHVSVGISVILLLSYAAYVVYGIFGWESLGGTQPEGRTSRVVRQEAEHPPRRTWPLWLSVAVLGGATAALAPTTDILTNSVVPVTNSLHLSQFFVGMVIVANAGNVAEAYSALKLAKQMPGRPEDSASGDSGLDLALGIASASSVQIATFTLPIIVFYGLISHHMNLVFGPVELAIFFLLVLIFAYIAQDGESNWLEGSELLALYAMAAILFYVLPPSVFGQ